MKRAMLLTCALLLALFSCSKENIEPIDNNPEAPDTRISVEEAMQSLDNILDFLDGNGTRTFKRTVSEYYLLGETAATRNGDAEQDEEALFYLFNFADDEGFAIVGADTRLPTDVFAVADSGNIDPEEGIDNPGLALFLAALGRGIDDWKVIPDPDITKPDDPHSGGNYETYSDWTNRKYDCLRSEVTWHQKSPYNEYAPWVNDTLQGYAGCVPIAVAQLMSCWEYPEQVGTYNLNWSTLKNYPVDYWPTPRGLMAARLVEWLSSEDNLDVTYEIDGSGAYSSNIARTLRAAGYSRPGTLDGYDSEIVDRELTAGMPVLAEGKAKKTKKKKWLGLVVKTYYDVGHEWLIEELLERTRTKSTYQNGQLTKTETETENLVYCNWGWAPDRHGNTMNGYYYHQVFNANKETGGPVQTRSYEENNYQFKIKMHTGVRR